MDISMDWVKNCIYNVSGQHPLADQGKPGRTSCLHTRVWWVSTDGIVRVVSVVERQLGRKTKSMERPPLSDE